MITVAVIVYDQNKTNPRITNGSKFYSFGTILSSFLNHD